MSTSSRASASRSWRSSAAYRLKDGSGYPLPLLKFDRFADVGNVGMEEGSGCDGILDTRAVAPGVYRLPRGTDSGAGTEDDAALWHGPFTRRELTWKLMKVASKPQGPLHRYPLTAEQVEIIVDAVEMRRAYIAIALSEVAGSEMEDVARDLAVMDSLLDRLRAPIKA